MERRRPEKITFVFARGGIPDVGKDDFSQEPFLFSCRQRGNFVKRSRKMTVKVAVKKKSHPHRKEKPDRLKGGSRLGMSLFLSCIGGNQKGLR